MLKPQKSQPFPIRWREYQDCYYEGTIEPDDNLVLITGDLPNRDIKVVAFDFDGKCGINDYIEIAAIMKGFGLSHPHEVVYSANRGFHFIYLTDKKNDIRNKQNMVLKKGVFPESIKDVDVRGDGGLLYYPPTKFCDSMQPYMKLLCTPNTRPPVITDSSLIVSVIDKIYTERERRSKPKRKAGQTFSSIHLEHDAKNITAMRQPLRELLMPGALDIEEIALYTGEKELLYWKALFLEVLWKNIDMDTVFRLLAEFQPSFDYFETVHQLKYMDSSFKPYKNTTLKRLFPDWERPTRTRERRGIVD